jgi:hypothetical protein
MARRSLAVPSGPLFRDPVRQDRQRSCRAISGIEELFAAIARAAETIAAEGISIEFGRLVVGWIEAPRVEAGVL